MKGCMFDKMDGRGQEKFGNAGYKHSVSSRYGQKMGSVRVHAKRNNKNDEQSKNAEDEYRLASSKEKLAKKCQVTCSQTFIFIPMFVK